MKNISLICSWKNETNKKNNITMGKYLGALLVIIGTIMLVVSYISGTLIDMNLYQWGAIAVIVLGVVLHITLTKKA